MGVSWLMRIAEPTYFNEHHELGGVMTEVLKTLAMQTGFLAAILAAAKALTLLH